MKKLSHRDHVHSQTQFSFFSLSLRGRLIVAVLITTLPLLVLVWHGAQREYERESLALEQEVQRITAFITGDVNHLLESTRQMLIAVSWIHRSATPEQERQIFSSLAERCPYYTRVGVVNLAKGNIPADLSTLSASGSGDEALLQRASRSDKIVVGKFQASSPGGKDLLSVAYRVEGNHQGSPVSICYVVLDFGWLNSLLAEERVTGHKSLFPEGMVLNILDRSGTILTRYPDKAQWTGRRFPDSEVFHKIIQTGEGTADLVGLAGLRRLYAFKSVEAASGDIIVSIGVSRDVALQAARRNMRHSLVGVSLVGLVLILAAWYGTGFFITRPLASLVGATQRLGEGDLATRSGEIGGPREITQLARAFDRMAETLQREADEREAMQKKLVLYDRQLRSMSVETVLVEEHERKQIAAGLHDKAGPLLATCFMKLGRVLKVSAQEEVTVALEESRTLIDQAIGELRSLTFDLSSPALYTLGLTAAVEELCRDMGEHHGMDVNFQDQGTPQELGQDQRIVLYRAARELLLNVVKHAEARRVTVICGGDAEEVFVSVGDDGVGFDATEAGSGFSRTGGFGLFNLHERVTHLNGRFVVESSRGSGTRVVVALPVVLAEEDKGVNHGDKNITG